MLLHVRIQIANITKPPVWRKLTVPDHLSFLDFHILIQAAFGWHNAHLFQFSEGGFGSFPAYTIPDPGGYFTDEEQVDAATVMLAKVFKKAGQKYVYIYDFGDGWIHNITLEKISGEEANVPTLIDGKGACPPEDCGGPWGYAALKETLNDPKHPEYEELREWLGLDGDEQWDPAAFSIQEAQEAIRLAYR